MDRNSTNNSRNLLAVVNLVVTDDQTEILEVYEGEDVVELVQSFCNNHGLEEDCVEHMVRHINQQISQAQLKNQKRRQQQEEQEEQQNEKQSYQNVIKGQTSIQTSQEEVEETQSITTDSSTKQMTIQPKYQQQQLQQQADSINQPPLGKQQQQQQLEPFNQTNESNPQENNQNLVEQVNYQQQQLHQQLTQSISSQDNNFSQNRNTISPPISPCNNFSEAIPDQSGIILQQSKQSHKQLRFNLKHPPEYQHNKISENISNSKQLQVEIFPNNSYSSNHHSHTDKSSVINNYTQPHRNVNTANRFVSAEKKLRMQQYEQKTYQKQEEQQLLHKIDEISDSSFDHVSFNYNEHIANTISSCDKQLTFMHDGSIQHGQQQSQLNKNIQINFKRSNDHNIYNTDEQSIKTNNIKGILKSPKTSLASPRLLTQQKQILYNYDVPASPTLYRPSFVFINQPQSQQSNERKDTINSKHRSQTISVSPASRNNCSRYDVFQNEQNNKFLSKKQRNIPDVCEQINQPVESSRHDQLGQEISHRTIKELKELQQHQSEISKQKGLLVVRLLRDKTKRKVTWNTTTSTSPALSKNHKHSSQQLPQLKHEFSFKPLSISNTGKLKQSRHEHYQVNHTEFSFSHNKQPN